MSQSLTYPSNKLLSLTNVTPWNIYLLELLFAFPDMGVAIRSGVPFKLNEPTMDDRFKNSNTRKTRWCHSRWQKLQGLSQRHHYLRATRSSSQR